MRKLLIAIFCLELAAACSPKQYLFLYDIDRLQAKRKEIRSGKAIPAYKKLLLSADSLLAKVPTSVVDKVVVPPSGDKHDYMSQGPYWWPDPKKENGLPYIRRDGQTNPEIHGIPDCEALNRMADDVFSLSLAYYFSREQKYAQKATELLKVWFLNSETRMNPNFNYAQRIPGICDGRGIGLIDAHIMANMLDGVKLLKGSSAWTKKLDAELVQWFAEFAQWMSDSPVGKAEFRAKNNHGTYYDFQYAAYLMYVGKTEAAAEYIRANAPIRFDNIAQDGSQPRELARTISWDYTQYNLVALMQLACLADRLGINLWDKKNKNGSSLKDAVEWFFPYLDGTKDWNTEQISGNYDSERLIRVLMACDARYGGDSFSQAIGKAQSFKNNKFRLETSIYSLLY